MLLSTIYYATIYYLLCYYLLSTMLLSILCFFITSYNFVFSHTDRGYVSQYTYSNNVLCYSVKLIQEIGRWQWLLEKKNGSITDTHDYQYCSLDNTILSLLMPALHKELSPLWLKFAGLHLHTVWLGLVEEGSYVWESCILTHKESHPQPARKYKHGNIMKKKVHPAPKSAAGHLNSETAPIYDCTPGKLKMFYLTYPVLWKKRYCQMMQTTEINILNICGIRSSPQAKTRN